MARYLGIGIELLLMMMLLICFRNRSIHEIEIYASPEEAGRQDIFRETCRELE